MLITRMKRLLADDTLKSQLELACAAKATMTMRPTKRLKSVRCAASAVSAAAFACARQASLDISGNPLNLYLSTSETPLPLPIIVAGWRTHVDAL
jgi:hypothetical protein